MDARDATGVNPGGIHVLAVNCGSSSLKFGVFRARGCEMHPRVTGEAQAIGSSAGLLRVRDGHGGVTLHEETVAIADSVQAFGRIARLLAGMDVPAPDAIGHRIVHGGPRLRAHARIDAAVMAQLEAASIFAPLHVPAALSVVRAAQARYPSLPQVACLDTAFHAALPEEARTLPIDRALLAEGVQRYGFHGLSCASILAQWPEAPPRLVIAHLGSGASVTAVREGRSVDTSMGMTPNGGVVMATRSGDLDPGVLTWLIREKGMDARALERLVDHRSGLLGISGISGDLRRLRQVERREPAAKLAIGMFVLSVRKQIAAMTAVLHGIDALVFTGGIGEHDAQVRADICEGLGWAGIRLDASRNRGGALRIGTRDAACEVRVMPSEEERQICRHVHALLAGTGDQREDSASPPSQSPSSLDARNQAGSG
ncbi:acetate/propionate family kinase [Frateuria soli]|uniref:acetate/propionate family kinase n=1 Tax=Frateuria soli TaxID=1542730 RepID=UPI001E4E7C62|nr:acetate/propionate family kinase [Frateuria soli]UGB39622.1 acetate/propionate family kinase [Frateuria soli]